MTGPHIILSEIAQVLPTLNHHSLPVWETLHAYTPSRSPSTCRRQYFSPAYIHTLRTHQLHCIYTDINLALSSVAWITCRHRGDRASHRGGLLHQREVKKPGLCGHPASTDLRTCECKQEISVCSSVSHLSSSLSLTLTSFWVLIIAYCMPNVLHLIFFL